MNAIVPASSNMMTFADVERLGVAIAKSGLFGIKTPEQAIALMMIAHAEGRHPALAARDYDIINGKPSKKAEAMLRDFLEAGGKVQWHKLTDDVAEATFSHPQGGTVRISWDMDRATKAGLKKDMYQKYPRQMLRSRCVSEGVRTVWPGATSGFYGPEEVATIEGEGETPSPAPQDERDALNATVPVRAAAAATPPSPRRTESATRGYTEDQWRAWLARTSAAMDVLRSKQEVVEVGERESVRNAIANGPDWLRRDLSALLAEHFARFPDEPEEELPELEILGEEKLAG